MGRGMTILVVEDKESMARMLVSTLKGEGYSAISAGSAEDGLKMLDDNNVDLVLSDMKLPGMNGLDLLKRLKEKKPMLPVIMMTAFGSIELAVEAVKSGAYDFLTKPFDTSHMMVLVDRALEAGRLASENMLLREEFADELGVPRIIGKSNALSDVIGLIRKAAPTKATVLLTGESGTGKELFARAVHHLSPRASGPFVPINCAAIPRELLESELFGHEKGAFTGAETRRMGKFELADKGTVFLDEVGEMDMSLQAKLLRVLQDGQVERVGGDTPVKVDVRVVAASNRDLEKAAADGEFREDLYYRLNVFPVAIPPLRERPDDIPLLATEFAEKYGRELNKKAPSISQGAMETLLSRGWKGNVRELENCIERAVILEDGGVILPEHLGEGASSVRARQDVSDVKGSLLEVGERASRAAEEAAIMAALQVSDGNKTKAAEALGVSYKTLLNKIKDYGIG